jgi:hypothetical protein
VRTTAADLDGAGRAALVEALAERGIAAAVGPGGIVAAHVDGHPLRLEVTAASAVDGARAAALHGAAAGAVPVLVADRILGGAPERLRAAGWSWLDRRGWLFLRAPGVLVDVAVAPRPRRAAARATADLLAGRGAQEAAVALLDAPDRPVAVRGLAARAGLAPSTISRAVSSLRAAGLVRRDGRPVVPDLFWALAERWTPQRHALAVVPDPAEAAALGARLDDVAEPGWAVGDTRAALAWGAPLVAASAAAPALYVPDRDALAAALERWGPGAGDVADAGGATVALAPVSGAVSGRQRLAGERWPVVPLVVAALDLAADRARGHQVLDEWQPPGADRVW